MLRTHYSSELGADQNGKTVTVAGWAHKIRDIGKVKFLVIHDKDGEIQITAKKNECTDGIFDEIS